MVNLAVAEVHTFFVGDDGWLVHNDRWKSGGIALGLMRHGKLREFANSIDACMLTDFNKPPELDWHDFAKSTLNRAARERRRVHFNLTDMNDLSGVLNKRGPYRDAITTTELCHIRDNWSDFKDITQFYRNGRKADPPWIP
jgi:hypothetical protein